MIYSKCERSFFEGTFFTVSESGHRIAAALYLSDSSDMSDKAPERIRF